MTRLLYGLGIRGFRSFHGDRQLLVPLDKINLIAGQNNSGKSNALRFASQLHQLTTTPPEGLDIPQSNSPAPFELAVALPDPTASLDELVQQKFGTGSHLVRTIREVLASPPLRVYGEELLWLRWSIGPTSSVGLENQAGELSDCGDAVRQNFHQLCLELFGGANSERGRNEIQMLNWILQNKLQLPKVKTVEASRRITDRVASDVRTDAITGDGLVQRLLALQSPPREQDQDRARFEAINRFLRAVLDEDDAQLEIPYNGSEINVRRHGLLLPLESLGTGVSQVIILAAAATLEQETLICMEEPEVHLHPLLQRKLLRYLHDETDNQYLIATHSAHMLDSRFAQVFHATYTYEAGTTISNAGNAHHLAGICADLGYRPSDLLQSNATIWVEGPSDRIYISRWISIADPDLREGIDYSIMFYGGRLLSHLTADDPDVEEFISLRRLNRHLAIMIDSDRDKRGARINRTKQRVVTELSGAGQPGLAWVTLGRTVENYVPEEILTAVLSDVHKGRVFTEYANQWSDVLRTTDTTSTKPDKVKVARAVTNRWSDGLEFLHLRERILDLVNLIRQANGHPPLGKKDIPRTAPRCKAPNPADPAELIP